jgi:LTXXQ motif family protein
MKIHALIAVALLSATSVLAYAQTPPGHEAHHPNAASESQPAPAAPPQPKAPSGMMGQGGMMGGSNSMMGMMGGGMPMMGMMQMMTGSGGMGGMATIDRVEGRIAFLKTELKITDAQSDAWNAFADVLRGNAKKLGELRGSMAPQGSLADRLEWQEKWLTARAEGTRGVRTAYADLAAKLSDEQKATAEQLLAPHMGMMTMMSGMGGGQMMGPGRMGMGMDNMGNMSPGQMPMMPGNPATTGKTPQQ